MLEMLLNLTNLACNVLKTITTSIKWFRWQTAFHIKINLTGEWRCKNIESPWRQPYLTLRYRVIKGPMACRSRSSQARKVPTASIRDWCKVPERSPMGIKPGLEDVHSWWTNYLHWQAIPVIYSPDWECRPPGPINNCRRARRTARTLT